MRKIFLLLLLPAAIFSCRKETPVIPETGLVRDIDGQYYLTRRIGNDIWTLSNLNVSRFRNGDSIPEARTSEEWQTACMLHQPAWCYYNNDPENGEKYGKIYNWAAVSDYRGLAPEGWVIPALAQWSALVNFLGGDQWQTGKKLKSTSGWLPGDQGQDGNGSDEVMFKSLPGGTRYSVGTFSSEGNFVKYWSSTKNETSGQVYHALMSSQNGLMNQFESYTDQGLYVRCVMYK